jgi:hypothetical protein
MGCPACDTDYGKLEQEIDTGRMQNRDELERRLVDGDLFIGGATVVYCPGCAQKINRLMERVSSRLRKQTLGGIHDLLSRNRNERSAEG